MTTDSALQSLLENFINGSDRSMAAAGKIEVALDDRFGDEEPFADLALALASYRPGGGEFLYDEEDIVKMALPTLRALVLRKAGGSPST